MAKGKDIHSSFFSVFPVLYCAKFLFLCITSQFNENQGRFAYCEESNNNLWLYDTYLHDVVHMGTDRSPVCHYSQISNRKSNYCCQSNKLKTINGTAYHKRDPM